MSEGQSAHYYKPTLDALPANIAVVDLNGQILLVNKAWRDFAKNNGVSPEAVSEGVNYLQVCDQASGDYSKEAKPFARGIRMVLSGEKKGYIKSYPCHSPSQKRWFVGNVAPFPTKDERQVLVVHVNVTKLKKTEHKLKELNENLEYQVSERTKIAELRTKQLQYLTVEVIEAEERERRRIAGLLHEDLQQALAGARLILDSISGNLPGNIEKISEVRMLLDDSISKSRSLAHELSPAMLYYSGLGPALERLCGEMREHFGLDVDLHISADINMANEPLKVFLFRSAKELLFNVVKHAGTKKAEMILRGSGDSLAITISDRGRGFDPSIIGRVAHKGGLGLMTIRERARYIGGELLIQSSPGKGSRLVLTAPMSGIGAPDFFQTSAQESPADVPETLELRKANEIRVLFVDDHKVMRQGLIQLVAGKPNISVIGEAANGLEAIELVRRLKPDVVVMDVSMPEMDGIEATRRIKAENPQLHVIGLSMHEDEHIYQAMRRAGAESFLSKTTSSAELLKAIYGG